jgi:HSP20 family protein
MAEQEGKVPVKSGEKAVERAPSTEIWQPFQNLRQEIDRLFEDFGAGFWRFPTRRSLFETEPFWRRTALSATAPAVDVVEKETAYEITAELPGMDEKNIDVTVADDMLTIQGEKREEKEEKKKDYYLSERRFGSFERSFRLPEGVESDKVEASFKKGVLTVILPKTPEAQKKSKEKKIAIKTA